MADMTIKELVSSHINKDWALPTIQREFVWLDKDKKKIEQLFDSLMRQYPIGHFVCWKVEEAELQHYKFLSAFDRKDADNNIYTKMNHEGILYLVLDGQQRITSLNIALAGKIVDKLHKNKVDKYLYLNLLFQPNANNDSQDDFKYEFEFLSDKDAEIADDSHLWIKVSKVMAEEKEQEDWKNRIVDEFIQKSQTVEDIVKKNETRIRTTLGKLWNNIRERKVIYDETDKDFNEILNIFARLNTAGVELNKSDLLLSYMENHKGLFPPNGARESITDFVKRLRNRTSPISDKITLKLDTILKACLVLTDGLEVQYNQKNFTYNNLKKVSDNWNNIERYMLITLQVLDNYGIDKKSGYVHTAIIVVACYLMTLKVNTDFSKSTNEKNIAIREDIVKWFCKATLTDVFSSHTDTKLKDMRKEILDKEVLPSISEQYTDDDLNEWLDDCFYNGKHTQLILHLTTENKPEEYSQDHIYPQDMFDEGNVLESKEKCMDSIYNLQLLTKPNNESKNKERPDAWFKKQLKQLKEDKLIPIEYDLTPGKFDDFIKDRKKMFVSALKKSLGKDK